jgi:hypothetical protein
MFNNIVSTSAPDTEKILSDIREELADGSSSSTTKLEFLRGEIDPLGDPSFISFEIPAGETWIIHRAVLVADIGQNTAKKVPYLQTSLNGDTGILDVREIYWNRAFEDTDASFYWSFDSAVKALVSDSFDPTFTKQQLPIDKLAVTSKLHEGATLTIGLYNFDSAPLYSTAYAINDVLSDGPGYLRINSMGFYNLSVGDYIFVEGTADGSDFNDGIHLLTDVQTLEGGAFLVSFSGIQTSHSGPGTPATGTIKKALGTNDVLSYASLLFERLTN